MPVSLFSISVWSRGILGCGGLAPMHIWLLKVAKLCCVFIFFDQTSLTLLQQKFAMPKEAENLQQLLVFLQQKTVEENAHIMELKKYHLQLQQVCNVYMSVCEQCCRLCNNSIPFKVYNEKSRDATYITVFDGVCQFLTTSRKILVNIVMLRAHCHT